MEILGVTIGKEKEGKPKNEKTEKGTAFKCVEDCWMKSTHYRRGDVLVAEECPPHFVPLKEEDKE
jgi:hypothetical protein